MQLLISPTSPYARKARIVILEKKLSVQETKANPWEAADIVAKNNPLNKIPVLLTDDGAIVDSRVICEFLDSQNDTPRLLPADPKARFKTKTHEAIADGAVDAFLSILMASKVAPDMQNEAWKNWLLTKTNNALDFLNKNADGRDANQLDMGDIATGCLIGTLDFRLPQLNWREKCPTLADWYETISARESFLQTVPSA